MILCTQGIFKFGLHFVFTVIFTVPRCGSLSLSHLEFIEEIKGFVVFLISKVYLLLIKLCLPPFLSLLLLELLLGIFWYS